MGHRLQEHLQLLFQHTGVPTSIKNTKSTYRMGEEIHSKPEEEGERNWAKLTAGYIGVENK